MPIIPGKRSSGIVITAEAEEFRPGRQPLGWRAGLLPNCFYVPGALKIHATVCELGGFAVPGEETQAVEYLNTLKEIGDTAGGIIRCTINGLPAGLGEPVFDKLQAGLAQAMLSINAVKGFEYGSGFAAARMKGSEHNDAFVASGEGGDIRTATNFSGGIQGGISNGMPVVFRIAFNRSLPSGYPRKQ